MNAQTETLWRDAADAVTALTYSLTFGVYNQTGPWSDVRALGAMAMAPDRPPRPVALVASVALSRTPRGNCQRMTHDMCIGMARRKPPEATKATARGRRQTSSWRRGGRCARDAPRHAADDLNLP